MPGPHFLWRLYCVVFARACQTQSVLTGNAFHNSHCLVPCFVIYDQSWKWTENCVISSSKHEMCFHVFHPWSRLHFRAHQAGPALAAQWPDFRFAPKPVTEVWSTWMSPHLPQQQLNSQTFAPKPKMTQFKFQKNGGGKYDVQACVLAFSGHFVYWMGMFKVFRWNGIEILIPKHPWKSIIGPLEQI